MVVDDDADGGRVARQDGLAASVDGRRVADRVGVDVAVEVVDEGVGGDEREVAADLAWELLELADVDAVEAVSVGDDDEAAVVADVDGFGGGKRGVADGADDGDVDGGAGVGGGHVAGVSSVPGIIG